MPAPPADQVLDALLDRHGRDPGRLVQILREVVEAFGHVPPAAVTWLAAALGLPRTRVEGVAGFYAFFPTEGRGRYRVLFSHNVTDVMAGSDALRQRLLDAFDLAPGEVSRDGRLSVDTTSCTGLCDQGPALLVNGRAVGRLTPARIGSIAALIRSEVPVDAWPEELFVVESHVHRRDQLLAAPAPAGVAIEAALRRGPAGCLAELERSGLRGRGGAGFPTGIKWKTVLDQPPGRKYIVCNADEGDSGTFADRMIMEGDPFVLIEGMAIAGLAVGATEGYVYIRSEYPHAFRQMGRAVGIARKAGLLGPDVFGSGRAFELHLRLGAGAYICGEETSLLESLEGKRGQIRFKPPLPAIKGLFGQPTVINNVISLASVPIVLARGADFYKDFGMGRSRGTLPIQLAGNVKRGGLIEKAFGITLRELIYDYGGGTASGRPFRAVQVGGPLGAYFPEALLDLPLDYESFAGQRGMVGHGGVVVFDDTVDLAAQARFAMEFCAIESCGKCTPCRIGSTRGVEVIDRIVADVERDRNLVLLDDLCETMLDGSLCALGGLTPYPVQSALKHFPEDFDRASPRAGSRSAA